MTNDKRIGGLRNSLASHSEPVRQILRVSSRLTAKTDEILPSGRGDFGPTGKTAPTRLVQYRARKQAVIQSTSRLLTRAVLYRRPNVAWPDLGQKTSGAPLMPNWS